MAEQAPVRLPIAQRPVFPRQRRKSGHAERSDLGQFRTHALQQMALLFDNLVNDSENARWNIQVERLDGRKVDNELEFD
jgi:hypothetical protein